MSKLLKKTVDSVNRILDAMDGKLEDYRQKASEARGYEITYDMLEEIPEGEDGAKSDGEGSGGDEGEGSGNENVMPVPQGGEGVPPEGVPQEGGAPEAAPEAIAAVQGGAPVPTEVPLAAEQVPVGDVNAGVPVPGAEGIPPEEAPNPDEEALLAQQHQQA